MIVSEQAFPTAVGLKFTDPDKPSRLIINRDGVFVPPHGGWLVEGRVYTVNERSNTSSQEQGEKCGFFHASLHQVSLVIVWRSK